MKNDIKEVRTFGDARQLILQTIMHIRDGGLNVSQGMAMAANFKVLNDNIQCEINAAKLAVATSGTAHEFGQVRKMGLNVIGESAGPQTLIEGKG